MNKCVRSILVLSAFGLLAGCGSSGPPLVPAEGVVMHKGAALADAGIIVLYPDASVAQAQTDANGKFQLTYNGRNGAMPGQGLKVSVFKGEAGAVAAPAVQSSSGPPSDEELRSKMGQMMKSQTEGAQTKANQKGGPKSLIDPKYNNASTSGLTLDIPAAGSKDLKVELQ